MVITDLLKFNEHSLPENFVSIAVAIDEDKIMPFHAAILIRHENKDYLHHYDGVKPTVVEDFNEFGWYVYKIIDSININDADEVGAFLQYCKRVCSKSNITYSFIADGSYYDINGEFISNSGLPELGTCVGFCINTLNNALIDVDSILELDDWDDSSIEEHIDNWSQRQANAHYPDLDWNLYNSFKKRITPLEYLCTAFIDNYPIKKVAINSIKDILLTHIKSMYVNS